MSKLLTVFGATGQQGGALINHILDSPYLSSAFTLRGITRDSSKAAAIALKERGVEIVEADLQVPSTIKKAVAGSHAVFGVTNFWESASYDVEVSQGKAIADAAVEAGVKQIIWSSLPSVTKISGGKVTSMKHFDGKAEVETYIRTLDIKSVFFMPGWFMQNHLLMKPKKADDGTYLFSLPFEPSTLLPLIDIRDTGNLTEMAETWTKVTGKTVVVHVPKNVGEYDTLSEAQREELKGTSALADYGYYGPTGTDDLAWTLEQVTEKLRTWEEFVRDNEPWFA
ncbi:hypothetical protein F5Y04DRAFT_292477 [Hypomontagnella monticulosa]|nr:hypothetical protein F5Y04DRAFT_292477 [Hypomontagnella monticulosa]